MSQESQQVMDKVQVKYLLKTKIYRRKLKKYLVEVENFNKRIYKIKRPEILISGLFAYSVV